MLEDEIIDFILKSEALKRIHRSGWQTTGAHVADFESVAAHSWGSSLIALLISRSILKSGQEINIDRVLTLSLLHDISEAEISDIPRRATEFGGEKMRDGKVAAEREVFRRIVEPVMDLLAIDNDHLDEELSLEKRVVRAADLLDMLFHAISLERAGTDPALLEDFFITCRKAINQMEIELAKNLYIRLEEIHKENSERKRPK
jgi:putative hydrolase of HD superfamily